MRQLAAEETKQNICFFRLKMYIRPTFLFCFIFFMAHGACRCTPLFLLFPFFFLACCSLYSLAVRVPFYYFVHFLACCMAHVLFFFFFFFFFSFLFNEIVCINCLSFT
jgi:hypothetical protein